MRIGIVERGNYKTVEVRDPESWQFEVNGYTYNFGTILHETKCRIAQLWGYDLSIERIQSRLNFAEQRYFERMLRGHYGLYRPSTGAYVCLGLVGEKHTCDLALHEMAHALHDEEGTYSRANEMAQEAAAILAEEEFCLREFEADPHATAQRYVHMLKALPSFATLPFRERWQAVTTAPNAESLSLLVNRYLDAGRKHQFGAWLDVVAPDSATRSNIERAAAVSATYYDIGYREMLFDALIEVRGRGEADRVSPDQFRRILTNLRELQRRERAAPRQPLQPLIAAVISGL